MWDDAFEAMLRQRLPFLPADEPLTEDSDLRENGLDSLAIVDLLVTVEGHYDVRFGEEALTVETFATPGRLWQAITAISTPSV
jgi:acyl carrier protein